MTKEEMTLALKEFKEDLPTYLTEADLNKSVETMTAKLEALDMSEAIKELKDASDLQGLAMKKLETKAETKEPKTIFTELKSNEDAIKQMAKGNSTQEITLKADTLRANVTDSKLAYTVPDIGQLDSINLTLSNLFAHVPVKKGSGGQVEYYDWDSATTVKAAAVVAEGGTFPANTAKWAWYALPLVKVGAMLPVSEEFEQDMDKFYSELALFMQTDVDTAVDEQLYSGTGSSGQMTGLYTASPSYTATPSGLTDASIYDLVVKLKSSIVAAKGKYKPNFALMNPSDIDKYKLKKDDNHNYIMPPFVSKDGKTIDGITIVESGEVTANTMVIGDNRFAKIYDVEGYSLTTGLATGDYESDMKSLKAKRRLMILMKNADKPGFLKVTSISGALATLAS